MRTISISPQELFHTMVKKRCLPTAMVTPPLGGLAVPCMRSKPRHPQLLNPLPTFASEAALTETIPTGT